MAPEIQAVVRATQAWLQSSWHVQVPFAWLEACVEWLREEAGGTGRLSQQQINQQVGRMSDCTTQLNTKWSFSTRNMWTRRPLSWVCVFHAFPQQMVFVLLSWRWRSYYDMTCISIDLGSCEHRWSYMTGGWLPHLHDGLLYCLWYASNSLLVDDLCPPRYSPCATQQSPNTVKPYSTNMQHTANPSNWAFEQKATKAKAHARLLLLWAEDRKYSG